MPHVQRMSLIDDIKRILARPLTIVATDIPSAERALIDVRGAVNRLVDGVHRIASEVEALMPGAPVWRLVGAQGQPAFQNSWVNFGTGANDTPARFRKDIFGIVWVEGMVKNGVAGTIFTLPAGYRPGHQVSWTPGCNNQGVDARVTISRDGTVDQFNTGNGFVYLNVSYLAEH